jgi:hypothetical protein
MKKLIKEFHNQMVEGCHPLDPIIVYIFGSIAFMGAVFYYFN